MNLEFEDLALTSVLARSWARHAAVEAVFTEFPALTVEYATAVAKVCVKVRALARGLRAAGEIDDAVILNAVKEEKSRLLEIWWSETLDSVIKIQSAFRGYQVRLFTKTKVAGVRAGKEGGMVDAPSFAAGGAASECSDNGDKFEDKEMGSDSGLTICP